MKESKDQKILFIIGLIPVIWIALLIAPSVSGGLPTIIKDFPKTMENPFSIVLCSNSIKTILIFIVAYILGIGIYLSTKRNYRKREEHGSAKWGEAKDINKKYEQVPYSTNKILTQNVCIGYDGRKHRRNLNTLIIGGSGAGKTRFYAKPNVMQANTSLIILDPKGEIARDEGYLLEEKGVFRSNRIIVTNPRKITEDMVINIYKKSTLSINRYFQCIYCLLFRKYINASRYIINDIVNKENVNEAIKEFEDFAARSNGNTTGIFDYDKLFPEAKEIYNILKDIRDK